ncbi:MAG: hypothetical protein KatS3mg084_0555 [Candidatus Dojkabacteria bacterium]|nr:MAG: hypothetical protein KatS3mg084_0555 [Candidatus Dojkabacteria bacterium]
MSYRVLWPAIDEYGVYKATKSLIQKIVGSIPHELLYGQKIFIDGVFKDFQFPNADSNFHL